MLRLVFALTLVVCGVWAVIETNGTIVTEAPTTTTTEKPRPTRPPPPPPAAEQLEAICSAKDKALGSDELTKSTAIDSSSEFAEKLLTQAAKDAKANIILSPINVHLTTALLYASAQDDAIAEYELLAQLFPSPLLNKTISAKALTWFENSHSKLTGGEQFKGFYLNEAFLKKYNDTLQKPLKTGVDLAQKCLTAKAAVLDFSKAEIATNINADVSKATGGKATDLVGALAATDASILVGAYSATGAKFSKAFKGTSQSSFGKNNNATFLVGESDFYFAEEDSFTLLGVPSDDGTTVLYIFLPKSSLSGIFEAANETYTFLTEKLDAVTKGGKKKMAVSIPELKLAQNHNLEHFLKKTGIGAMFDKDGFNGFEDMNPLIISKALHHASLEVTAAAAASTVPAEFKFNANKPFLFVLRAPKPHSVWLLAGVVNDA